MVCWCILPTHFDGANSTLHEFLLFLISYKFLFFLFFHAYQLKFLSIFNGVWIIDVVWSNFEWLMNKTFYDTILIYCCLELSKLKWMKSRKKKKTKRISGRYDGSFSYSKRHEKDQKLSVLFRSIAISSSCKSKSLFFFYPISSSVFIELGRFELWTKMPILDLNQIFMRLQRERERLKAKNIIIHSGETLAQLQW